MYKCDILIAEWDCREGSVMNISHCFLSGKSVC